MSHKAANNELKGMFNTQWGVKTPIAWPNVDFNQPATAWVRFNIIYGDSQQTDFGGSLHNERTSGVVIIQVFTPLNQGDAEALGLADDVANIFRNWCGTNIRCRTPAIKDIGNDGFGWYQVNVSIPFIYDELH